MLTLVALMSLNLAEVYADGCSGVNLKGARDYSVGQTPYAVAAGDFNSDGKPDIAAADYFGNSVRIAFGNGSGAFASFSNFPVGFKPSSVAVGDVNGDGKLDVVTANYDSNNVSVLLNNGAGVFSATNFSAGINPEIVTLADFNGDGKLDVAVTNPASNAIAILLNNGTGGLLAPGFVSLAASATPKDLVAADFNGDSKTDLATANNNGTVSILLGTGTGAFGAPTNITVPPGQDLKAIAVGDFSGDGKLDLVVASYNGWYIKVLNGNGSGGFTVVSSALASITYPTDVELRDINADGKLDVVAVSSFAFSSGATVNIYYGNGTGGSTQSQVVLTGYSARSVAIADFNSDSKPDFVTNYSTGFDAGLSVALNDGTGKIETAEKIDPIVNAPTYIGLPLIADFNLDGRNDLAYAYSSLTTGLAVRLELANGDLGPATIYPAGLYAYLVSGDFNGDGNPDIAGGDSNSTTMAVFLNDGSGEFNAPVNYTVGGTVAALVTGDFNSDGKLDLVVASRSLHAVRVYIGDGNGGFQLTTSVNLNANPVSMVMGDFNNDGKLDVVTANACDGSGCPARLLTLFAGDGMGGFALPLDLNNLDPLPNLNNQSLAAGDFNGDGRLDLTITKISSPDSAPQVALNNGGGSFAAFTTLPTGVPIAVIAVGDINGDGKPDIVAGGGSYSGLDVRVLLNHGAGAFDPPVNYAGIPSIQGLAIGDINSDGKRDIVFSNRPPDSNASSIWKLLNKCALTRGQATTDFDGDGITDLSVFRPSTGNWYIIYSSDNSFHAIPFGASGDIPVPGDYEGDGKTDVAVWRPSNGTWYYLRSSDGQFAYQQFGANGDIPVQGDYDGDGKTNFAVFRPSTGTWYTSLNPAINYGAVVWGTSTDTPVPADYDGDGRTDVAVFRPSTAFWYLLQSAQGYREQQFGVSTDTPVPADYDGDGKANFGVFRSSTGFWYTSLNTATNYGAIPLGQSGDVLVPGYYDGDGRADAAVFRQGDWYIFQSTTSKVRGVHFGASGDIPAPFAP
jgi:hypothetical protein